MQRRKQQSARNPDAFGDVVVLRFAILGDAALALGEDDDQPGRGFEKRLLIIGAQRIKGIQPRLAGLRFGAIETIEAPLFLLGGLANSALDMR